MNFKLSALFFASGVMQIHGYTYALENGSDCWECDRVGYSNPFAWCRDGLDGLCLSECSELNRICPTCPACTVNALDGYNHCKESNDWKWNPRAMRGNSDPGPPRRHLGESDYLALLSSSCVETFYKISIKTIGEHGHIGCIAEPSCKDADNIKACVDCPSYVFHASLDAEHQDVLQKVVEEVVVVVDDDKENVKPDIYHEIKYLYALKELLDAFKDVELDDNKSYNLMFNNCGTFLIKMAHNLGIDPTDPAIINSVATMLSPTTKVGAVIGGSEYMARFIGNYVHAN